MRRSSRTRPFSIKPWICTSSSGESSASCAARTGRRRMAALLSAGAGKKLRALVDAVGEIDQLDGRRPADVAHVVEEAARGAELGRAAGRGHGMGRRVAARAGGEPRIEHATGIVLARCGQARVERGARPVAAGKAGDVAGADVVAVGAGEVEIESGPAARGAGLDGERLRLGLAGGDLVVALRSAKSDVLADVLGVRAAGGEAERRDGEGSAHQKATCRRPVKTWIGPRSRLKAGLTMGW